MFPFPTTTFADAVIERTMRALSDVPDKDLTDDLVERTFLAACYDQRA